VFQDGGHRRTRRGKSAKFEVYFLEIVCDLQDFTYLHISLDSGGDLEQFEVNITSLVPFKKLDLKAFLRKLISRHF